MFQQGKKTNNKNIYVKYYLADKKLSGKTTTYDKTVVMIH